MGAMAEDLVVTLAKFHRDVLLPDVKRVVGEAVQELRDEMNAGFDEMNGRFDDIYQRLDRLDTE
jgi:hypothetical protein